MQIIQGIRDKGAAIVIVVIALSLIGFILMDAQQGSSKIFGSNSSDMGKVNGEAIERAEFEKRLEFTENQEKQQTQSNNITSARSAQIREQLWNQIVAERIFYTEAEKLGIDFTSKELSILLSSNDPNNPLLQDPNMIDSATGNIDIRKVSQVIANIKKMKGKERDEIDARLIEPQKLNSISGKYIALLNASAYYPAWMEEKNKKENKNFATISYVAIPYNVISDSTIKVTDDEVEKYVKKHKALFKQEEGRMISYVAFTQLPSADDSIKTKKMVEALKNDFATASNVKVFLARNVSSIEFDSSFLPKNKIDNSAIDSIISLPIGAVYGPYVDRKNYVLAKMLGSKTIPDSVTARHILIPTVNPQTGQPISEDSVAKKQADSIFTAIKGGADFATLAKQYSSDGSKDKGGDLGTFGYKAMVPEFNDFCFSNLPGTKGLVKTQFGYHIIEVMSQKGSSPAYQIAYIAKEIFPSQETINKASLDATKLSAEKDFKSFEAYIAKNGIKKTPVPTIIKENDAQVGQLQDARSLVRWIFEAKKGEVSEPFNIGDQFVVAVIDKILKEGTQDPQLARPMAELAIRNEKIGEQIIKKLGTSPTLENAAAAYGKQIAVAGADSSLTFDSQIIKEVGPEPKLIGAVFNPANKTKVSEPIAGKTAVYVFKVNSITTKSDNTPEVAAQQKAQQINALRMSATANWFEALRKKASIKDNRSDFY